MSDRQYKEDDFHSIVPPSEDGQSYHNQTFKQTNSQQKLAQLKVATLKSNSVMSNLSYEKQNYTNIEDEVQHYIQLDKSVKKAKSIKMSALNSPNKEVVTALSDQASPENPYMLSQVVNEKLSPE